MPFLLLWVSLAVAQSPPSQVDALGWMAGCWRLETSSRVVDEQWMAPSGGGMLGMSRTVAKGRVAEHEFVQIREEAGQLVYIAQPSSQAQARFVAMTIGAQDVVFENLQHDFPQRIIYRRAADGGLHARIEGERNGQRRGVDFSYASVPCGAP
jgi:hypothetical protein